MAKQKPWNIPPWIMLAVVQLPLPRSVSVRWGRRPLKPNIVHPADQATTRSAAATVCLFSTSHQASSVAIGASGAPSGHGEALPLPAPRPLRCRGVRAAARGGRRDGRVCGGGAVVGPEGQVRVHSVRAHGVHLEGRHGLEDRGDAAGRRRVRHPDPGPGAVGRPHGRRPRLLRARQPGHLQRPGPLHAPGPLRHEPHLRRHRPAPRLVLQLRRGHGHGAPPRVRAASLHRRAVARHRRAALPPLLHRRQVRREEAPPGGRRRRRHRGRAVNRSSSLHGFDPLACCCHCPAPPM